MAGIHSKAEGLQHPDHVPFGTRSEEGKRSDAALSHRQPIPENGLSHASVCLACRRCCEVCCVSVTKGCATVAFESATASRADGPEGLLVPISGYRVPSLELIATPHLRVLGRPTSWSARACFKGADWLDPFLTPPLTLLGSASHHLNARLLLPHGKRQDWSAGYLYRRLRLHYLSSVGQ